MLKIYSNNNLTCTQYKKNHILFSIKKIYIYILLDFKRKNKKLSLHYFQIIFVLINWYIYLTVSYTIGADMYVLAILITYMCHFYQKHICTCMPYTCGPSSTKYRENSQFTLSIAKYTRRVRDSTEEYANTAKTFN